MPIETLEPSAVGPVDAWTLGAGASKVAASLLPDDDDTTYIESPTVAQIQEFECGDSADILSADTIDSVTIRGRVRRTAGISGSAVFGLRVGGGTLEEGANHALATSYGDFSDVFAQNPDSAAWSLADLNALRIRIRHQSGTSDQRATTLVAEIAYTRASKKSQHTMMLGVG